MTAAKPANEFRLGFLTALESPQGGYVGGLLVTNHFGRPLEFQCTTAVKPNRMQEILYGPTLVPYVLTELIGCTLLEKVSARPDLVLTERDDLLGLRHHVAVPVAHVGLVESPQSQANTNDERERAPSLTLGRQRLRFDSSHPADREAVDQRTNLLPSAADLLEPFQRIHEALQEAVGAKF